MPHVVIAPLVIGSVVTGSGLFILIFRRFVLRHNPESVARFSLRGDRVVPNTIVGVTIFGVVILVVGVLILLRGGLQLF
jgi:hypothetical protein